MTTNTSTVGTDSEECHFTKNSDEAGTKSTESTEVNSSKEHPVTDTTKQAGTNPS